MADKAANSTPGTSGPSVVAYTDCLKRHGDPKHPKVVEYRQLFSNDRTFQKRADVIDALFVRETTREPAARKVRG